MSPASAPAIIDLSGDDDQKEVALMNDNAGATKMPAAALSAVKSQSKRLLKSSSDDIITIDDDDDDGTTSFSNQLAEHRRMAANRFHHHQQHKNAHSATTSPFVAHGAHSAGSNNNKKKRATAISSPRHKNNDNKSNKNKKAKKSSNDDTPVSLEVTKAVPWDKNKQDPTGYYLSEKLDGMRCIWKDGKLWSRNGKEIDAPDRFLKALPKNMCLDGELFAGRQEFQTLMSIVKSNRHDKRWSQVSFLVFDAPLVEGPFPVRLHVLRQALAAVPQDIAKALKQTVCKGKDHVDKKLEAILSLAGEGVMLKKPNAEYVNGRSKTLLKVKKFHDAEAVVVGHGPGKGRNEGRLGSLQCKMKDSAGKIFNIGSGFTDAERENPPPIGATVTYKYQELTKEGRVPRFPTYLRVRPTE